MTPHGASVGRGKRLSEELRKLATQVHTVKDDGTQVTKEEALAELVWEYALGWTEHFRDDSGNLCERKHPPVAWAMQYLYERLEGRAAVQAPDPESGLKAADKVRELVVGRLNSLAAVAKGPPAPRKP